MEMIGMSIMISVMLLVLFLGLGLGFWSGMKGSRWWVRLMGFVISLVAVAVVLSLIWPHQTECTDGKGNYQTLGMQWGMPMGFLDDGLCQNAFGREWLTPKVGDDAEE